MITGLARTFTLVAAMAAGVLLPQLHVAAGLIPWLIVAMLFLVFLQTRLSGDWVRGSHGVLLAANVLMGFVGFAVGSCVGGRNVALACFFAGITPTATAAPVIVSFLRGRVDYVVASFVITNLAIAVLSPCILPWVLGGNASVGFWPILGTVALVIFVPAVSAFAIRRFHARAAEWPTRLRGLSFAMWVLALLLICSNASYFIKTQVDAPTPLIVRIALTTLAICAVNFALGFAIGRPHFAREASQSLGQKNTTFTIYLALTYASPVVALGPTFYVVWHNLWNSWQLHRARRLR